MKTLLKNEELDQILLMVLNTEKTFSPKEINKIMSEYKENDSICEKCGYYNSKDFSEKVCESCLDEIYSF